MLGCNLGPRFSRIALSSSGAIYPIHTKIVGQSRRPRLWLSEKASQLDMPAVVQHDAAGLDISRFDFIGLELADSVEHRVEQVPDLNRKMYASL